MKASIDNCAGGQGALEREDPELYAAIQREERRLCDKIQLIASENFASQAVFEATGSILTQKYAEGFPGRRYYQGCEWIDVVERLAIERAKAVFGADHANVQPHSGSQANQAVYLAAVEPGDLILAMDLAEGGHLTHGSPVNITSKLYRFVHYGVDHRTGRLDYDVIAELARRHRPKLIVAGATAYPRIIDFARFRAIADEVGAVLMVDMAHIAGLVAAGVHPSPVPHADFVSSSTHKTLRGPRGGMVLCRGEWARALDRAVFPGLQGGPLEHVIAAKAVALREAQQPEFVAYQKAVVQNAKTLAVVLSEEGLRLVSGGTDNHLILMDLGADGPSGAQVAEALDRAGIVCNKNAVPGDKRPPSQTSGIRVGTPAVTTLGYGPREMAQVGRLIARIVHGYEDEKVIGEVQTEVRRLATVVAERSWLGLDVDGSSRRECQPSS
ncbi:MAG: serine hydroxymethyltransferase [Chloroflexota bacterium]